MQQGKHTVDPLPSPLSVPQLISRPGREDRTHVELENRGNF